MSQQCGPKCWYAESEDCDCSCGGVNHGCGRSEGAVVGFQQDDTEEIIAVKLDNSKFTETLHGLPGMDLPRSIINEAIEAHDDYDDDEFDDSDNHPDGLNNS